MTRCSYFLYLFDWVKSRQWSVLFVHGECVIATQQAKRAGWHTKPWYTKVPSQDASSGGAKVACAGTPCAGN